MKIAIVTFEAEDAIGAILSIDGTTEQKAIKFLERKFAGEPISIDIEEVTAWEDREEIG